MIHNIAYSAFCQIQRSVHWQHVQRKQQSNYLVGWRCVSWLWEKLFTMWTQRMGNT